MAKIGMSASRRICATRVAIDEGMGLQVAHDRDRPACRQLEDAWRSVGRQLLEQRPPADRDVDIARPGRRRPVDEVHALTVGRHVVVRAPVSRPDERHAQQHGCSEYRLCTSNGTSTKAPVEIDIEEFASISSPDRLAATIVGRHEAPRGARHRPDEHLSPSILLGHVGQPPTVR